MLQKELTAMAGDQGTIDYMDFTQIIGCKNTFFAQRLFQTIDADKSGDITVREFSEIVGGLRRRDIKTSMKFLFRMIDEDNSGTIQVRELMKILAASLEESGSKFTSKELKNLAYKLRDMFLEKRAPEQKADNVTFEEFERVMAKYPDILTGLSLEGMNTRSKGSIKEHFERKRKKNFLRSCMRWMQNNPQLTFTYALFCASFFGLYMWMFLQYSGNCEGVDMNMTDNESGVSRVDVMEFANQWRSQHHLAPFTIMDMKYMSFSESMTKNDPLKCQAARRRILLSWTLPMAKGAGQTMKGIFTIILLPVSRNLMTTLQNSFLRHIFPFHDAVEVHKNLGRLGFFLAWLHTMCYVVIVYRWQSVGLYKQWSWAFPSYSPERAASSIGAHSDIDRDLEQFEGIPSYLFHDPSEQPPALDVLKTWFGITGVILMVIYTIAALFALDYPKKAQIFDHTTADDGPISWSRKQVLYWGACLRNFNNFWYTHHLFAIFYICLLLHPLPHIPNGKNEWGGSDSWLWVMTPIALYLLERIVRCLRSIGSSTVAVADIYKDNVVHLKVACCM